MSGTSADGVDVALVRTTGAGLQRSASLVRHHHLAYAPDLKARLFRARSADAVALRELAELGRELSLVHARAVNELLSLTATPAEQIDAIAAHGQTLFHAPPLTIQWFDPSLVAAETGCVVVSDFRRADCAAGGQGAPLVPLADFLLFSDQTRSRVLLNLGGIANVTYLPAGGTLDELLAFDTGPGNCILDHLVRTLHPEGTGIDENGRLAVLGTPDASVVLKMLATPFFRDPPPKSTDAPTMIDAFHAAVGDLGPRGRLPALLASAALITAESVVRACRDFLPNMPAEVIASGGGTRNPALMRALREQLAGIPLLTSEDLGVPAEAKEAIAFALLGAATLDHEPGNVPAATGARRRVVLGSITPAP